MTALTTTTSINGSGNVAFAKKSKFSRTKLEELLKKRFFYAQAFGIYGGVGGLYDYGPPGCALQANLVSLWRSHFILEENMLEVDCTALTPHDVLKTSGHVDRFTDYMVKDLKTGDVYRADHLLEAFLAKKRETASSEEAAEIDSILAQIDNFKESELDALFQKYKVISDLGNAVGPVHKFNLMFSTSIGPAGNIPGYLRPETAQGQFVNFRKLLECNNDRMPFASAMIGKSFRNEISPRSGLLRVREFLMAEVEHYVHPEKKDHLRFSEVSQVVLNFLPSNIQEQGKSDIVKQSIGDAVAAGMVNNQTLGYFLARTAQFLWRTGIDPERLRFRQHMRNEMAHYASDCWDAEILNSYGWIECVGCADRACFDLSMHTKVTGERLMAREKLEVPTRALVSKIIIDKKGLGMSFKTASKEIAEHLESLSEEEATELFSKVSNDILTVLVPKTGNSYQIPLSMVKLEKVEETKHVLEYIPAVIEPSFGLGRIIYSILEHSFWTREADEQRAVLSIPAAIAPTKCLIAPLSQNDDFSPTCQKLLRLLRKKNISCQLDESSATIGKRYSRFDEIGVPFATTVDFQSIKDSTVTIRERDSTQQIRVHLDLVGSIIESLIEGHKDWNQIVEEAGGLFTSNNL
jgi:glycyl-tRNA synthetase